MRTSVVFHCKMELFFGTLGDRWDQRITKASDAELLLSNSMCDCHWCGRQSRRDCWQMLISVSLPCPRIRLRFIADCTDSHNGFKS
jgi:hypothetical protein